ncbi:ABC transporter permease [Rothia terrae]|uniref:ABC transporter permease n=1 Tax=Rothia terrae TaxID=396015 RepID=UPI0033D6D008
MAQEPVKYEPLSPLTPQLHHYEAFINSGRLVPVGTRSSVCRYLKALWRYRGFVWHHSRFKVQTSNNSNRLGSAWLVLRPLMDVLFYWALFGLILKVDRGMQNYPAFVIIGILMFQFTSTALNGSARVIQQNKSLINAFNFPRIVSPLSMMLKLTLETLPVIAVMFISLILAPPHALPLVTWVLFIPIFILQCVFNLGIILVVSRIGYVFPDIQPLISFATRFLLYGSGVIFPITNFINHPVILSIIQANPIYIILDMYRQILISGVMPPVNQWITLLAWAFGLSIFGFFFFWRAEERYGAER